MLDDITSLKTKDTHTVGFSEPDRLAWPSTHSPTPHTASRLSLHAQSPLLCPGLACAVCSLSPWKEPAEFCLNKNHLEQERESNLAFDHKQTICPSWVRTRTSPGMGRTVPPDSSEVLEPHASAPAWWQCHQGAHRSLSWPLAICMKHFTSSAVMIELRVPLEFRFYFECLSVFFIC